MSHYRKYSNTALLAHSRSFETPIWKLNAEGLQHRIGILTSIVTEFTLRSEDPERTKSYRTGAHTYSRLVTDEIEPLVAALLPKLKPEHMKDYGPRGWQVPEGFTRCWNAATISHAFWPTLEGNCAICGAHPTPPRPEPTPEPRNRMCQNCSTLYTQSELDPLDDVEERVSDGDIMPSGQCPDEECGAVCYPVMKETTMPLLPATFGQGAWHVLIKDAATGELIADVFSARSAEEADKRARKIAQAFEIEDPAPEDDEDEDEGDSDTQQCSGEHTTHTDGGRTSTTKQCETMVDRDDPDEPYFATPCGTFCRACMADHVLGCGVCAEQFPEAAGDDDEDEDEDDTPLLDTDQTISPYRDPAIHG